MTLQSEKYTNFRIINALAITDTAAHNSDISDVGRYTIGTFFVNNGLNQAVSAQIYGNITNSTTGAVTIGAAFTVATTDQESRTITSETAGWLPYIYIVITAAVAPASGSITVNLLAKNPSSPK